MGSYFSSNNNKSEDERFIDDIVMEKSALHTKFNDINNKYINLLQAHEGIKEKVLDLLLENSDLKAEKELLQRKYDKLKLTSQGYQAEINRLVAENVKIN